MFCNKCGNKLADNAKFCNKCGAPVKAPSAPVVQTPVAPVNNDTVEDDDKTEILDSEIGNVSPAPQPVPSYQPVQPQPYVQPVPAQKSGSGATVAIIIAIVIFVILILGGGLAFAYTSGLISLPKVPVLEKLLKKDKEDDIDKFLEELEDDEDSEEEDDDKKDDEAEIEDEEDDDSQPEEEYYDYPVEAESEYIIPYSDSVYLSMDDLVGFSEYDCRIARNEIYARHGRLFDDENLQAHFDNCGWYVGYIEPKDFKEDMLSDIELANRDLIVKYEKEMGYR